MRRKNVERFFPSKASRGGGERGRNKNLPPLCHHSATHIMTAGLKYPYMQWTPRHQPRLNKLSAEKKVLVTDALKCTNKTGTLTRRVSLKLANNLNAWYIIPIYMYTYIWHRGSTQSVALPFKSGYVSHAYLLHTHEYHVWRLYAWGYIFLAIIFYYYY